MSTEIDWSFAGLCRVVHRGIHAEVAQRLAAAGLDAIQPPQYPLARVLYNQPEGIRSTAIAAELRLTKPAVKEALDALVAAGLAERVPDPTDGRAHLVRLTSRGRELIGNIWPIVHEVEAEVAGIVGEDHYPVVREALRRLSRTFPA